MVSCAYCERALICDGCQAPYVAPSQEHYEALSQAEEVILCPACEKVLICHWCKTPYDGSAEDEGEA